MLKLFIVSCILPPMLVVLALFCEYRVINRWTNKMNLEYIISIKNKIKVALMAVCACVFIIIEKFHIVGDIVGVIILFILYKYVFVPIGKTCLKGKVALPSNIASACVVNDIILSMIVGFTVYVLGMLILEKIIFEELSTGTTVDILLMVYYAIAALVCIIISGITGLKAAMYFLIKIANSGEGGD